MSTAITKIENAAKKSKDYALANPKTILYAAAAVTVAAVGYKVYKKVFPAAPKRPELIEDSNLAKSTLTDVQAQNIAEKLFTAMATVGTDEKAIFSALSGLNANDFLKVYNAFGMRQYSLFWGNVGDPITSDKHHLITWLANELSVSDAKKLEQKIPGLKLT